MVLLDMDPGHDDALALLAALAVLEVAGITTVAGNQTVDKTTLNARRVLHLAGRSDIAVAAGADRPWFRSLVTAAEIHGVSGLDGYDFPQISAASANPGAQALIEGVIAQAPQGLDWIATGPLTNVASFLAGHPHWRPRIRQLAIMGGSLGRGNITKAAEFNIYVDPDAAQYVFQTGLPIRLVGLDVTHKALLAVADRERFLRLRAPLGEMLYALFGFYGGREKMNTGLKGVAIHDVLAVAALVEPELFSWHRTPLQVERCNQDERGATRPGGAGPAVDVAVDIDVAGFFAWLWGALSAYEAPSRSK